MAVNLPSERLMRNDLYRKAFEEEEAALAQLSEARERYLAAHRRRSLVLRNVIKQEQEES